MTAHSEAGAVVAGGSGLVGRALLTLLATDETLKAVWSIGRRAVPTPPPVQSVVAALDDIGGWPAGTITEAYCCLGTTRRQAGSDEAFRAVDLTLATAFARSARAKGATTLAVVSSAGADARGHTLYLRTKGEFEQAIQTLGYVAVHILRPSILDGERTESRPIEALGLKAARLFGHLLPNLPYRPIDAAVVARALVTAARRNAPGVHIYEPNDVHGLGVSS